MQHRSQLYVVLVVELMFCQYYYTPVCCNRQYKQHRYIVDNTAIRHIFATDNSNEGQHCFLLPATTRSEGYENFRLHNCKKAVERARQTEWLQCTPASHYLSYKPEPLQTRMSIFFSTTCSSQHPCAGLLAPALAVIVRIFHIGSIKIKPAALKREFHDLKTRKIDFG